MPRNTGRLLRLLASVHIIAETSQDHYELTELCLGNMWQWVQCRHVLRLILVT